jgi:hypothetical protein
VSGVGNRERSNLRETAIYEKFGSVDEAAVAGVGASPHSIEASVNPAILTRKTRFRPKLSPSLPPVIRNTPKPIP